MRTSNPSRLSYRTAALLWIVCVPLVAVATIALWQTVLLLRAEWALERACRAGVEHAVLPEADIASVQAVIRRQVREYRFASDVEVLNLADDAGVRLTIGVYASSVTQDGLRWLGCSLAGRRLVATAKAPPWPPR